jgi:hypothetical protein
MPVNEPFHIKMFNDRVKGMNHTKSQNLTISAKEARDLQADIFDLLETVHRLTKQLSNNAPDSSSVGMDGGSF